MVARHAPSGVQMRAVLSSDAEAIRPLPLVDVLYTMAVWPIRSETMLPSKSQTLSVMSWDADTTPTPSSRAKPLSACHNLASEAGWR
jgi:hypothetical protein